MRLATMGELNVGSVTVPELLEKLYKKEWMIPKFQRDFVWLVSDVVDLLLSIVESRPIGMATLWEQAQPIDGDPGLALEPIFVLDYDPETKSTKPRHFCDPNHTPAKTFAILDGRQRCTAIAMAFGGLRATHGGYRYSGRYYLDVKTNDEAKRVVFKKETEINKESLTIDVNCISKGLFPLTSNLPNEALMGQWVRYLQSIRDPAFYQEGKLPAEDELKRRNGILTNAFEGIVKTKLAVYTVPESYDLADICEIFETLNTTGTKVSTVDLIHSWLYSDTEKDPDGALELRQWISDLGQKDGAIGWASSTDRPELVAQIVTACYIALETKAEPRKVKSNRVTSITSIKAADLLATPTLHWKNMIRHDSLLAEIIGDFQKLVAGGTFPYTACPYPASAAVYVALRWHKHFDAPDQWGRQELDSLYRAFFWRNALSNRYDQGFLSQLGTDIKEFKKWLESRQEYESITEWAAVVQKKLPVYMEKILPTRDQLIDELTDGRPQGAMQKALVLPMLAGVKRDLVNPEISLAYPPSETELHHIYPRSWCATSRTGELAELFDEKRAGRDWVDSTANIMPLSRKSNNAWRAKAPGQILLENKVTYAQVQDILKPAFIDRNAFDLLLKCPKGIKTFWEERARTMADDLLKRTSVVL
jgi:hypothetical protein